MLFHGSQNLAIIKTSAKTNLVNVIRKPEHQSLCSAKIKCPFCNDSVAVFHILKGTNELGSWNSSNFNRHLKNVHVKEENLNENIDENLGEKFDEKLDVNLVSNVEPMLDVGSIVKYMKYITPITKSNINLFSIVSYSDTDEDNDNDEKNGDENKYLFVEVPGKLDPVIITEVEMKAKNIDRYSNDDFCAIKVEADCNVDKGEFLKLSTFSQFKCFIDIEDTLPFLI